MGLFSKKNRDTAVVASTKPNTTSKVPLVPFKILEANIPFFADEACTQLVPKAVLLILQPLDPEDSIQELMIVPTTLRYEANQYVNLIFENTVLWEDCWFKDTSSGEIQKAFNIHVAFNGEVIEDSAIAADKARIEELELGVQQKIQQMAQSQSDSVN